jgi:hypothetical protein
MTQQVLKEVQCQAEKNPGKIVMGQFTRRVLFGLNAQSRLLMC